MPAFTASQILSRLLWPGMMSLRELTTAISGRPISSSVIPSALSRLRCGARAAPTLMASLRSCMFRVLPPGVTAHKKILAASTCTRTSWEQRSKPRTDNGVADSGYLPHAIAKVIRKARKTFAPNCSEVAFGAAHHRLAASAGSLRDGFVLTFLVNTFRRIWF